MTKIAAQTNLPNSLLGKICLKDHTQVGTHIPWTYSTLSTSLTSNQHSGGAQAGLAYPNPSGLAFVIHPMYMVTIGASNINNNLRGRLPGIYSVHNNTNNLVPNRTLIPDPDGYTGRTFAVGSSGMAGNSDGQELGCYAFDITGPWR